MSYFDKFMKDLEQRKDKKIAQQRELAKSEEAHSIRHRVKLYSERWQNRIRYGGANDNRKKTR
mgnify:CR=1 FL=1